MFCQTCGKEKRGAGAFCFNCGAYFLEKAPDKQVSKVSIFPACLSVFFLFLALFSDSLDIGYFTFLRWVVAAASAYYLYVIYKNIHRWNFWAWAFVLLGILFNPIVQIYLDGETWQLFDFVALIFFSVYFFRVRKGKIV